MTWFEADGLDQEDYSPHGRPVQISCVWTQMKAEHCTGNRLPLCGGSVQQSVFLIYIKISYVIRSSQCFTVNFDTHTKCVRAHPLKICSRW